METVWALWLLIRPKFVPFLLLLPFFGWAWAHWDRALRLQNPTGFAWVLAAWVVLHAGTMWLNAALDQDEGEVLMGASVKPPAATVPAAYAALILCVPMAFFAGWGAGLATSLCAVMAVGYSHPAVAWKGRPLAGPLVNLVGYGLASPYAGWSVVGVPGNPRTYVCWALFGLGILAPYFAAQAFQREEDAERGYRTFVVEYGPARTLLAARAAMMIVLGGGVVLAAVGWIPRVCLFALPLWIWIDRLLVAWSKEPDGGTSAWAVRFAGRVLTSAIVLIALCLGEYLRESFEREPVAGLGTLAGHPGDRPRLPPLQLRIWEHRHGMIAPGAAARE
ncbi:MAG: UbiA family prenyltransferase [Alphaproteobacteria bacterium]|nr:UbiA family prenyltransferase [Alphaproteobacteria bacterium]